MLVLGTLAFGLYAVLIPHKLFKILVAAYRENRLWEDEDFLESHGWLVLKYKPKRCVNPVRCSRECATARMLILLHALTHAYHLCVCRWWFEFAILYFKVFVVCVTELMNSPDKADLLLIMLQAATGLLLLLVIVDRPYSDSAGHDGMTGADALQMLSLVAQLANYRLAAWCLEQQRGDGLSDKEELSVALVAVSLAVAPFIPAIVTAQHRHRKAQEKKRLVAAESTKSEDGGDNEVTVKMKNPLVEDEEQETE